MAATKAQKAAKQKKYVACTRAFEYIMRNEPEVAGRILGVLPPDLKEKLKGAYPKK